MVLPSAMDMVIAIAMIVAMALDTALPDAIVVVIVYPWPEKLSKYCLFWGYDFGYGYCFVYGYGYGCG